MGVTLEGWDEAFGALDRMAQVLDDERTIAAVALEGVKPMVQAVADRIGTGSAWRESGMTRRDIHASVDKESAPGLVKIAIGASKKHAFKVRFNELGTSRQPAYPSLRPGHDETISQVTRDIAQNLAARFRR